VVEELDERLDGPDDRRGYDRARLMSTCSLTGKMYAFRESIGRESRIDRA